jgi:TRAP-type C4-dicarboxylate transport system permease small subunit
MELTGLMIFIWTLGFIITLGMVYEAVSGRMVAGKWYSWYLLILILLFTWPIAFGGIIVARKRGL